MRKKGNHRLPQLFQSIQEVSICSEHLFGRTGWLHFGLLAGDTDRKRSEKGKKETRISETLRFIRPIQIRFAG
jgi:hypothetical protein